MRSLFVPKPGAIQLFYVFKLSFHIGQFFLHKGERCTRAAFTALSIFPTGILKGISAPDSSHPFLQLSLALELQLLT